MENLIYVGNDNKLEYGKLYFVHYWYVIKMSKTNSIGKNMIRCGDEIYDKELFMTPNQFRLLKITEILN